MNTAPDFANGYPSEGALIGPAWQEAWDVLMRRGSMASDDLATVMCAKVDIQWKTAKNLLASARRAGVVAVDYRTVKARRRAVYRIPNPPSALSGPSQPTERQNR